ncbi:MAG TPA: DsrE family protein [Actinomycetota bacterium]|nr:DsrE family protein [Actinomycetota bacterium]
MASILVHITTGPEHPSKVALGLLVARTALEDGHSVSVFLAADAVQVIRDPLLDSMKGVGTGSVREHFDGIVAGGGRLYLSKMSSAARGVTDADIDGKPAQWATPHDLVRLITEHDRTVTY